MDRYRIVLEVGFINRDSGDIEDAIHDICIDAVEATRGRADYGCVREVKEVSE